MYNKKIYLIIIFTLIMHTFMALYAYADAGRFIRIAVQKRKDIQIAKEQIELLKIRVVNAARVLGPSIMLQYRESDGEALFDKYRSKAYVLKGNQSIFVGGKKYNTLRREMRGLKVAENEMGKINQTVKFDAIKTYYSAIFIQEKIRNSRMLLEECQNELLVSKKKYESKIITQVEYLEVEDLDHL